MTPFIVPNYINRFHFHVRTLSTLWIFFSSLRTNSLSTFGIGVWIFFQVRLRDFRPENPQRRADRGAGRLAQVRQPLGEVPSRILSSGQFQRPCGERPGYWAFQMGGHKDCLCHALRQPYSRYKILTFLLKYDLFYFVFELKGPQVMKISYNDFWKRMVLLLSS